MIVLITKLIIMKTSFSCSWLLCQSDVRPSTKPKYKTNNPLQNNYKNKKNYKQHYKVIMSAVHVYVTHNMLSWVYTGIKSWLYNC